MVQPNLNRDALPSRQFQHSSTCGDACVQPKVSALAGEMRDQRCLCGLSLDKLGQKTGIDFTRLSRFERGEIRLRAAQVAAIRAALGMELRAHRLRVERELERWQESDEVPAPG